MTVHMYNIYLRCWTYYLLYILNEWLIWTNSLVIFIGFEVGRGTRISLHVVSRYTHNDMSIESHKRTARDSFVLYPSTIEPRCIACVLQLSNCITIRYATQAIVSADFGYVAI